MDLTKKCPACPRLNPPENIFCACGADISSVTPGLNPLGPKLPEKHPEAEIVGGALIAGLKLQEKATPVEAGKTVVDIHPKLLCRHGSQVFSLESGSILGRNVQGKEFLSDAKTVSRKHAIFIFEKGNWFVEDLGSTNGTYVNNTMIPAKTRQSIKKGNLIGLSRSITFEIIEATPEP